MFQKKGPFWIAYTEIADKKTAYNEGHMYIIWLTIEVILEISITWK